MKKLCIILCIILLGITAWAQDTTADNDPEGTELKMGQRFIVPEDGVFFTQEEYTAIVIKVALYNSLASGFTEYDLINNLRAQLVNRNTVIDNLKATVEYERMRYGNEKKWRLELQEDNNTMFGLRIKNRVLATSNGIAWASFASVIIGVLVYGFLAYYGFPSN
jgi:hypothetical protein